MKPERLIRLLAGSVILLGLGLGHWVHPGWLLLSVFAAVNLMQSAFTGFCPPTLLLEKLGWIHRDGLIHLGREKTLASTGERSAPATVSDRDQSHVHTS